MNAMIDQSTREMNYELNSFRYFHRLSKFTLSIFDNSKLNNKVMFYESIIKPNILMCTVKIIEFLSSIPKEIY